MKTKKQIVEELLTDFFNYEEISLTRKQQYDICYIIGNWYLIWKSCLFDSNTNESYINAAAFMLKNMIRNHEKRYDSIRLELDEDQYFQMEILIDVWSGSIKNGQDFGYQKEILKQLLCECVYEEQTIEE